MFSDLELIFCRGRRSRAFGSENSSDLAQYVGVVCIARNEADGVGIYCRLVLGVVCGSGGLCGGILSGKSARMASLVDVVLSRG